jgi:hypothetical protein
MSSTNKTTNYELSQFVGSDKPAWLADYNQDMAKIDAGIHTAQSAATAADGKADTNTSNIGDMTYLATTAKNTIVAAVNEVNSKASTAQNTANEASTKASANTTAIGTLANKFNLNTTTAYALNDMSVSSGTGVITSGTGNVLWVAHNDDASLFKIYGTILFTPSSSSIKIRIPNTGVTTDSSYVINGAGIFYVNNNPQLSISMASVEVNNNYIDIVMDGLGGNSLHVCRLFACLYFNKDFGDIVPEN